MINLCIQMLGTFAVIFAYCELGERVGIAFDEINIAIEQLKWYLLPQKTRKMLLNIFVVAQEPVKFNILGSTACNRKTFKEAGVQFRHLENIKISLAIHTRLIGLFLIQVCNKAYSSFMILQRVNN